MKLVNHAENKKRFDVTSVGSTMIKLSVSAGERLETANSLKLSIGGSESNTMIALSRLGRKTAWVSRLRQDALGRRIRNEIRAYGVDVSHIAWADVGRNEIYFVEYSLPPRPTIVLYDRQHAAVTEITPADIDITFLLNTRILHLTGIFAALSPQCTNLMHHLISAARSEGVTVSFDLNYREQLWPAQTARAQLEPIIEAADVVVLTLNDARRVLGIIAGENETLTALNQKYGAKIYVLTLGEQGAVAWSDNRILRAPGYPASVVDRLGAGDSFAAGLLHGILDGNLEKGLRFGVAMATLKLGIIGDAFVSSVEEIMQLIAQRSNTDVLR